ncbi:MAG: helix-turn-helix domain-containing protein, partial [Paludibacteraceae bacterium]
MFSIQQLRQLCHAGENCEVEFKSARGGFPKSFWETFSAFANTNGGIIMLGVREKEQTFIPDGLTEIEVSSLRKIFWDTAHNRSKVSHPLLTEKDIYSVACTSDSYVLVFHIPRAEYTVRPLYLTENPFGHTYKRRHEGDYLCTDEEVRALLRDADDKGNDGRLLEHYGLDDLDSNTLRAYRQRFLISNPDHLLNNVDDKEFLRQLGGYYIDRSSGREGLTLAGLLLFGKGLPIREVLPFIRMDYLNMSGLRGDMRYSDRLTYDFCWENNLLQFFWRVMPKLKEGFKVPFVLHGDERDDDLPVFKLLREALTNMLSHSDFLVNGVLRIEKRDDGFFFSNP